MSIVSYRQMIGRAGRRGHDELGESILICKSNADKVVKELIRNNLPEIQSTLIETFETMYDIQIFEKFKLAILEMISKNIITNETTFFDYIKSTFYYACIFKNDFSDSYKTSILIEPIHCAYKGTLKYFIDEKLIEVDDEKNVKTTSLADAIISSGLSIYHGLFIKKELDTATRQFSLQNSLHALYHTTPPFIVEGWKYIDWTAFSDVFNKLNEDDQTVANLVQINIAFIDQVKQIKDVNKFANLKDFSDIQPVQLLRHHRFYGALALNELLKGKSLTEVSSRFPGPTKGDLQTLQQYALSFAGSMFFFLNKLPDSDKWVVMKYILRKCMTKLRNAFPNESANARKIQFFNLKMRNKFYQGKIIQN